MRSAAQIRQEIQRIETYKQKWPCTPDIGQQCDAMIRVLEWVLEDDNGRNRDRSGSERH